MKEEVCSQMAEPAISRHKNNEAIVLAMIDAFKTDACRTEADDSVYPQGSRLNKAVEHR